MAKTSKNKKTSKKKKRTVKTKRPFKGLGLFLIGFVLGIIFIALWAIRFHKPFQHNQKPIVYEDFSHIQLENHILSLSHLIEQQVLPLNLIYWKEEVKTKVWEGRSYPFTTIYIKNKQLTPKQVIPKLLKICKHKKGLNLQFLPLSHNSWKVFIAYQGLITHELIFTPKIPQFIMPTPQRLPLIALVVDDIGYTRKGVNELLSLHIPLTFSILPFTPYARKIAYQLHQLPNVNIMLHLPLEASGYHPQLNKQPGMLLLSMPRNVLLKQLTKDLNAVPFIVGVNNHMGSKFTQNRAYMKLVLSEIKKRHLFFIDSLTSSCSVAYKLAQEIGVPSLKRDIFLDATLNPQDIKSRLEIAKRWAMSKGKVVVICHPHPQTIAVLRKEIPKLSQEVRFVTVSELLNLTSSMSKTTIGSLGRR